MTNANSINRFFSRISIKGKNDCWNWGVGKDKKGYGMLKSEYGIRAHRFSYFIFYGDFDKKLDVLHECDNPSCCNPNHLFLGTHLENMKDMVAKGRSKRGENSGRHKLTINQAIEIKERIKNGEPDYLIAKRYNVSGGSIRNVRIGKSWFWIK